jgi:hypothetical protein
MLLENAMRGQTTEENQLTHLNLTGVQSVLA